MNERIRRRREERGIPANALAQRLAISPSYVSLIESGKKVPGEDIAESAPLPDGTRGAFGSILPRLLRSNPRSVAEPVGPAEPHLAVIPFLKEGADPAASGKELCVAGPPLRLDARLFPNEELGRLFACRATPDMARRAGGSVRPGDWLILTSHVEAGKLQGLFAVRTKGRILLSRLLVKGRVLLLLPPPGATNSRSSSFAARPTSPGFSPAGSS